MKATPPTTGGNASGEVALWCDTKQLDTIFAGGVGASAGHEAAQSVVSGYKRMCQK